MLDMSCIIHVNFKEKKIDREIIELFDKIELKRDGLIDFDRLLNARAVVYLVRDKAS